ncbi:hypothetical protein acdb102_21730 [Acidothermaceae bacterium B102]|nr:hypothetical protein acdb102_21730 [Acidothermaceae bacterium B102]
MILTLVLILFWLAAGHRMALLARRRNSVNFSYAIAALGVACAVTVKTWQAGFDELTGPYVSDLVLHLFIIVAGLGSQMFLLTLRAAQPARPEVAGRLIVAAFATTVIVVSFIFAPIHRAVTGGLDEGYGDLVPIAVYRVALNAYLTYVLVDIVRLCRRYADLRDDAGRSVGLKLVGWGCAAGLGYSVSRLLYALVDPIVSGRPTLLLAVGRWSALISLAALAAGVLTPWWLPSALAWREARRGTAQVAELWGDLAVTFPAIVLYTGRTWNVRRAQLRYDRCLIEIAEGLARASLGQASEASDIDGLAVALRRSRPVWAAGIGPKAVAALPTPATPEAEQRLLLALALAYSLADSVRDSEGASAC